MLVVLDRKALVSLLIHAPHAAGVVVCVRIAPCEYRRPGHEPTHFAVGQRLKHPMLMVGHLYVAEQLNVVNLNLLTQDALQWLVFSLCEKWLREGSHGAGHGKDHPGSSSRRAQGIAFLQQRQDAKRSVAKGTFKKALTQFLALLV